MIRVTSQKVWADAKKAGLRELSVLCILSMRVTIQTPHIPEEAKSELVVQLLEIIKQQAELIQELRDEIARLKGRNPRPKIAPSRMEQVERNKTTSHIKKRHL